MHSYLALGTYYKVDRVCTSQEVWWDKFFFLAFCMNTDKIIIKLRVVFHDPEIRFRLHGKGIMAPFYSSLAYSHCSD